jgi:outer membrane protein assembly factor BamB
VLRTGRKVVGGVVYDDSPSTVFALEADGGKPIWIDRNLLEAGQGPFGIQPQVADGRVYLASALGTGPHGGVLVALNASTGAVLWRFGTLLNTRPGVLVAGGAWETPLVGTDGSVTYGTGNPYQRAESAIESPSTPAYTDSDVNLAAATGKLRWRAQ